MSCPRCPCPDRCTGQSVFCEWAAKDPPNPMELRHICERIATSDYPTLINQVRSVVSAAVGFVASGFAVASDDEKARRLEICKGCERYDDAAGRCKACGCFSAIKARIESQSCPEGKW